MSTRTSLLVACMLYGFAAQAEDLKCSAPSAVDALRSELSIAATMNEQALSGYYPINAEGRSAVKQVRFGGAEPVIELKDFIGRTVDDSSKRCLATVTLKAVGRKDASVPIEYDVMKTEEDKVLVSGDIHFAEKLLIVSFDQDNGVYAQLDGDENILSKDAPVDKGAETMRKANELSGGNGVNLMPPSTGGGSKF